MNNKKVNILHMKQTLQRSHETSMIKSTRFNILVPSHLFAAKSTFVRNARRYFNPPPPSVRTSYMEAPLEEI